MFLLITLRRLKTAQNDFKGEQRTRLMLLVRYHYIYVYIVCVCVCIKYTFSQDHIEPYDSFIFCMFVCSFIRLYVVLWKSTPLLLPYEMIRNSQVVLIRCTWLTKQVWPPLKAEALSVCWSGPLLKKKKKGKKEKINCLLT